MQPTMSSNLTKPSTAPSLMRISDLGEFGLIELIQQWTQPTTAQNPAGEGLCRLTLGNGDDAAAGTFPHHPVTEFYTTDTMVDGVHFTSATTPWRDLGWKALASNISDVAAMGGQPAWALVTLGLPGATAVHDIAELYAGMNEICTEYGAQIIGGDLVSSPVTFITVALTGVTRGPTMTRSDAQPGHQVAVSGPVGGSAAGLQLLLNNSNPDTPPDNPLIALHRRPHPHVAAGKALAAAGVPVAMDVSDGLAADLGKLCKSSSVAARINTPNIPVVDALKTTYPTRWLDLALYGGEDYVLLFTAPPDVMSAAVKSVKSAAIIGEIVPGPPGQVAIMDASGSAIDTTGAGWDHFTNASAPTNAHQPQTSPA